MNVGILGSGDVGRALARGFAKHGHDVAIGSRDPAKLADVEKETGGKAKAATFADAAKHAEIVVLALNGMGAEHALDLAGVENFRGKLVLDATNPLDHGMPPGLFVGTNDSLGERIQRKLVGAHVVKCFNTVSNAQMIDPRFREGTPPMMICGDDASAKKQTEALLRELGWPAVLDVGGIDGARWLEALVPLWVRVAAPTNAWGHAFKSVQ